MKSPILRSGFMLPQELVEINSWQPRNEAMKPIKL